MENKKKAVTKASLKYIREIQRLTANENEVPNFSRKGEPFWERDCSPNIFKAHPDAAKSILYKPYNG